MTSIIRKPQVAQLIRRSVARNTAASSVVPSRSLNVHEHEGLAILKSAGVNVPRFGVAHSPEEAVAVCKNELKGLSDFVVKAQVLAGGRGKGAFDSGLKGGVKIVYSSKEVEGLLTHDVHVILY